jgi:hypothetical protein
MKTKHISVRFRSNAPYLFPTDSGCRITLLDRARFCYKTPSFHSVTTTGYTFLPVMNKSLHAALVKICTSGIDPLSHSCDNDAAVTEMLSKHWSWHSALYKVPWSQSADELNEALFVPWADSCAGPLSRITVTSTIHRLLHCSHIHCLVSVNIQQTSMNVNRCHFFQPAPLVLCCCHTATEPANYWHEGSSSTAITPTSASMSWANIIK